MDEQNLNPQVPATDDIDVTKPLVPRPKRRKSKQQIFKEKHLPFIILGVAGLLCLSFIFGSISLRREKDAVKAKQERITQLLLEEAAELKTRAAAMAAEYDIKIALEPIRSEETNFINSVGDAYDIIRRLPECKNLGINPDMYHMYEDGDDFSNLIKYKDYIFNVHMAEPVTRVYPKPGSEEIEALYVQFLTALKDADYTGNVSLEAHVKDFKADAIVAFEYLGNLAANI